MKFAASLISIRKASLMGLGPVTPWSSSRVLQRFLLFILLFLAVPTSSLAVKSDDLRRLEKLLGRAITQQDAEAASVIVGDLVEDASPEALSLVLTAMIQIESSEFFEDSLERLSAVDSESLGEYFENLLSKKKSSPDKIALVMMVGGRLTDSRSEEWLLQGLRHPRELVTRMAIDSVRKRRSKAAIPVLIEILEERGVDGGALAFEARNTLISFTQRNFDTAADWRKYWDANRETIDPHQLGEEDGTTGVAPVDPDSMPEFFGLKIVSTNVVFLVDISGSMLQYDENAKGTDGTEKGRQRITRVQRELSEAIMKLSKDAYFNVIAFNDRVERFQKKLVKAKRGAKASALKFVNKLNADRGTDTGLALEAAFQDPRVDTVVLLSDGAPHTQAGEPQQLIPIVEQKLRNLNRLRKVRLYTLGFAGTGKWPTGSKYSGRQIRVNPAELERFLTRLAEEHGGNYRRIE